MRPASATKALTGTVPSICGSSLRYSKTPVKIEISTTYQKFGDGGAVAALDDRGHHFAAASDELTHPDLRNIVAVYKLGRPERTSTLDLTKFLRHAGPEVEEKAARETDLESAARVGRRIYWIASHSRTSPDIEKGEVAELRPARWRFFATRIEGGTLEAVGHAYSGLYRDLLAASPFLADVERQGKGPKQGGISIEGLAAGKNGDLWIGFRSPLIRNQALVYPLKNPSRVIGGEPAQLGRPFTLNLGGRGIRDFQRVHKDLWYILAGAVDGTDKSALYRWNGRTGSPPELLVNLTAEFQKSHLKAWGPEGLMVLKNGAIYLTSDDGNLKVHGKRNKRLTDKHRSFRSVRVRLK